MEEEERVHKVENNQESVYRTNVCLSAVNRADRARSTVHLSITGIATQGKNSVARRYFRSDHHRSRAIRRPLAPREHVKDPLNTPGTKVTHARCVGKLAWHEF